MEDVKKSYYAIIPANVRYDKSLKPNAKLLYGEITALSNEKGYCWASNNYFAELYEVSKETVSRWVSQLQSKGYISVQLVYGDGNAQIINRYIRISQYPIDKKINNPIDENVKDNITVFNNTNNKRKCKKNTLTPDQQNTRDIIVTLIKEQRERLYPQEKDITYAAQDWSALSTLCKKDVEEIKRKIIMLRSMCIESPRFYKMLPHDLLKQWSRLVDAPSPYEKTYVGQTQ